MDEPTQRIRRPLRAIREHCLECCGSHSSEVAQCLSQRCPLWLHRSGHRPTLEAIAEVAGVLTRPLELPLTQAEVASGSKLKAIRRRCLDCSGYNQAEVKSCRHRDCPLWPYRMGRNPNRKGPPAPWLASSRPGSPSHAPFSPHGEVGQYQPPAENRAAESRIYRGVSAGIGNAWRDLEVAST